MLSSVICGLESDTVETIRTMRRFLVESGSTLAQVCVYNPYPGTKDFHDVPGKWTYIVRYANISSEDLLAERQKVGFRVELERGAAVGSPAGPPLVTIADRGPE